MKNNGNRNRTSLFSVIVMERNRMIFEKKAAPFGVFVVVYEVRRERYFSGNE